MTVKFLHRKKNTSEKLRKYRHLYNQCQRQAASIRELSHDLEVHGQDSIFESTKARGKILILEKCGFFGIEA